MIYYSLNNDTVGVFMKETLCDCKFQFDGERYSSVDDCLNKRKLSRIRWDPTTVPKLQQSNIEFYGFIVNRSREECIICDFSYDAKRRFQIELLIKAMLFTKYYEQLNRCSYVELARFSTAYTQCKAIATRVTLRTDVVELTPYSYTQRSRCCHIYVGKKKEDLDDIDLSKYSDIHIDMRSYDDKWQTYDMMMRKINLIREDCKISGEDCPTITLHVDGIEDMTLTAIERRYKNVNIVSHCTPLYICDSTIEKVDDIDIIMIGAVNNADVRNWDNVYII